MLMGFGPADAGTGRLMDFDKEPAEALAALPKLEIRDALPSSDKEPISFLFCENLRAGDMRLILRGDGGTRTGGDSESFLGLYHPLRAMLRLSFSAACDVESSIFAAWNFFTSLSNSFFWMCWDNGNLNQASCSLLDL